jgi:trimeric autotransporter adhesin
MQPGKFVAGLAIILTGFGASTGAQSIETSSTNRVVAASTENSVPRLVQFNGILKDGAARVVSGPASVTFAIYADQEGGTAIWSETQNVLADSNGHFSALLGTATSGGFPAELFGTGESRWLGVAVARQAEMPRALLASVPYALKAGDAQSLGGLPASSYVTTQQLAARSVTAAPSTTIIDAGGASAAQAGVPAEGEQAGAAAGSIAQSVTQATVTGTGTSNYLPLWTSGSNLGVSKIYQANGGFVGINTNTPLLQLDVNGNSIFRGSFQLAPQGTASSGAGQSSHSFQWQASLYDSSRKAAVNEAFGFRTVPATNNVAAPVAKLDLFYGPAGRRLSRPAGEAVRPGD